MKDKELLIGSDGRSWPTLAEAFWVWLRIALLSFGGPAGQIAVMHRILVEEKRWIGEDRFLHALNFCMLLPGPEAHQLTIYLGWLMHRWWGGVVAGILFILPGIITVMVLTCVYALYGDVAFVEAMFFGLKAAVLAIVLQAVLKIGRRSLSNNILVFLAFLSFLGIFVFNIPFPLIIFYAACIGIFGSMKSISFLSLMPDTKTNNKVSESSDSLLGQINPSHVNSSFLSTMIILAALLVLWLAPIIVILLWIGPSNVFFDIAIFFSKMAVVTFGGAYAVLAYVAQEAVNTFGWLKPGEMLDGLGLAETTPGPLIMVTQFVGFLAAFRNFGEFNPLIAGILGGLLTSWVTFIPCFMWIFVGAPYIERLRKSSFLTTAFRAITASVVGVILNLAVWFGLHVIFSEVTTLSIYGMNMPIPIISTIDVTAFSLVMFAIISVFLFRIGVLSLLASFGLIGIGLNFINLI